MAKLNDELKVIDEKLDDVTLYEKDPELVKELAMERGLTQRDLEELEENWLELTEQLDA